MRGALFLGDGAMIDKAGRLVGPKWIFSDDVAQGTQSLTVLAHRLAGEADKVKAIVTSHAGALVSGLTPLQELAGAK